MVRIYIFITCKLVDESEPKFTTVYKIVFGNDANKRNIFLLLFSDDGLQDTTSVTYKIDRETGNEQGEIRHGCSRKKGCIKQETMERGQCVGRTYVVHDGGPALHGDALEDGQHGETEVVEVGDAAVRSDPVDVADPAALHGAPVTLAARPRHFHRNHVYTGQPAAAFSPRCTQSC